MTDLIERNDFFLKQLMRHEGAKRDKAKNHVAYRCTAGKLTIGYGHNLDANPIGGLGENSIISETRARQILAADVSTVASVLDIRLPWWRNVGEARSGVLLNMAFNMGVNGLLGFQRMLKAVQEARWKDARSEMLASRWAGQVGRRAPELAEQMVTGEWQAGA